MTDRSRVPRAALQCAREGNVLPVTSLDRHTGRVALAASELSLFAENTNATDAAIVDERQHPAGSRDLNWRSPASTEVEEATPRSVVDAPLATESGLNFRSYSPTNCSTQSPIDPRRAWLHELEELTQLHRKRRELLHRGKARHASDVGDSGRAEWHRTRARGQVGRFARVRACQLEDLVLHCNECGQEHRLATLRCGHLRLCEFCRNTSRQRYRAMTRRARRAILSATKKLRSRGVRGRWTEKFFTLTLRHSGDVVRDLSRLPLIWRDLRVRLWLFFKHEYSLSNIQMKLLTFVRVVEVTPSDGGHAHLHVYILSPYLPHQLLRHLWGKALGKYGCSSPTRPVPEVLMDEQDEYKRRRLAKVLVTRRGAKGKPLDVQFWPVVDIQVGYGNIERELIKYLIKDGEYHNGKLVLVEPQLYARFYEGLEGIRTVVTSRYFRSLAEPPEPLSRECKSCHSHDVTRRRIERPTEPLTSESEP